MEKARMYKVEGEYSIEEIDIQIETFLKKKDKE